MRLKLPAYGKKLLDARRAGRHPLDVELIYGDRWTEAAYPFVAVDPQQYAPGTLDFTVLAGTRVTIADQLAGGWEIDESKTPATYGKFYDLVREVCEAGALVVVRWPKGTEPRETSALDMAFCSRWRSAAGPQWPRWWSDSLNARQRELQAEWLAYFRKQADGRRAA